MVTVLIMCCSNRGYDTALSAKNDIADAIITQQRQPVVVAHQPQQ